MACICDRQPQDGEGLKVVDPITLQKDFLDSMVIVCSHTYNDEICNSLRDMGFLAEQIISCPCTCPYFSSLRRFECHVEGYEWAYDFFEDELSKQLVLDRLSMYLCDKPLVPNTQCECYYEDGLITLDENEVFIDGGAFTGDTAERFINRQCGKYDYIYSFEPDPYNLQKAVDVLRQYPNVEVIPKGLWNEETVLSFCQDDTNPVGSKFVNALHNAANSIAVISLDGFFSEKVQGRLPTFIKMDVEGSERRALLGAKGIIRQAHPKLAICAYHKPEDIYELPQIILSIRRDYRFALRQHMHGVWDTVLYAV